MFTRCRTAQQHMRELITHFLYQLFDSIFPCRTSRGAERLLSMAAKMATSLARAVKHRTTLRTLDLTAAPDLICSNVMCAKLLEPCLCRVTVVLQKLTHLETLNLSSNNLELLPEAISGDVLPKLKVLNVSRNRLVDLPEKIITHASLQEIHVCHNPLSIRCLTMLSNANHLRVFLDEEQLQASQYANLAAPHFMHNRLKRST